MGVVLLIVAVVVLFVVIRPYCLKYDNIVCFTGSLGSGKSLNSTNTAVVLLRRQRAAVRWYNLFHPRHKKEKPMLYSNIPIRIGFKEYSLKLTNEHLLMKKRIVPKSVVYLDEVDQFASQLEWKNPNLARINSKSGGNFDEFVRLFRHYTYGGYLVFNTQSIDNVVLNIRRRMGSYVNLMNCRTFGIPIIAPRLFYVCKCRHISISEDIKTVEEKNKEDNYSNLYGFMPLFRRYDTYCYSGKYETVPYGDELRWARMKTNDVIACPPDVVARTTKSVDDEKTTVPVKRSAG